MDALTKGRQKTIQQICQHGKTMTWSVLGKGQYFFVYWRSLKFVMSYKVEPSSNYA